MSFSLYIAGTGHLADATREVCIARRITLVSARQADVVWCCIDMGVDENDESDVPGFLHQLAGLLGRIRTGTIVLISTQVPVGTIASLEHIYGDKFHFVSQPENIRKATAVADMWHQNRIIVGTRHNKDRHILTELFLNFTPDVKNIMFMSPESAEMVKHALNGFLALEITYANEIDEVCNRVGADSHDVFRGFRSDRRVGNGPLEPGRPYTGGTLGRDVVVLNTIGAGPVISAIKKSNDRLL